MKTTNTDRGLAFVLGLMTFLSAHIVSVAMWSVWFGGTHDPWFLNSGKAAAFTMGWLFGVSLIGGVLGLPGLMVAAGAATAMAIALMWVGGSTIFPIVLVGGGALILVSTMLGAWIGSQIGKVVLPRP